MNLFSILLTRDQSRYLVTNGHLYRDRIHFVVCSKIVSPDFYLIHRISILNSGPSTLFWLIVIKLQKVWIIQINTRIVGLSVNLEKLLDINLILLLLKFLTFLELLLHLSWLRKLDLLIKISVFFGLDCLIGRNFCRFFQKKLFWMVFRKIVWNSHVVLQNLAFDIVAQFLFNFDVITYFGLIYFIGLPFWQ